jgi:hypothetical protein
MGPRLSRAKSQRDGASEGIKRRMITVDEYGNIIDNKL